MGAMVEAVARHGYPGTTLRELVTLAGVSNTTFYEQFESLQDCFLATFDEIVARASAQVGGAYRSKANFAERLRAAFESYVDFVVAEPAANSLVLVDSLALGSVGVAHRYAAAEAFDLLYRQSFDQAPKLGEVSDLTIRAINGGIRAIVYRCLRRGEPEQLRAHMEELLDWGLLYQRPGGADGFRGASSILAASDAGETPVSDGPEWSEPPDSIGSRASLDQRERILRATAIVAGERGFGSLAIPAITAAAGVSNQTFYEHFTGGPEAFGDVLDTLGQRVLARVAAEIGASEVWLTGVLAGLQTLLTYLAENPLQARLIFIEVLSAGSNALDRVEAVMSRLVSLFDPLAIPAEVGAPPAPIVVEAIGGGIFVVIQGEIAQGRTESLPELLPEIAFIALAPFGVDGLDPPALT